MNIREIAKSIADELRADPSKWTQGVAARNADELPVAADSPDACQWCAIGFFWKHDASIQKIELERYLSPRTNIGKWNDSPNRRVIDVIALCDRVAAGEGA